MGKKRRGKKAEIQPDSERTNAYTPVSEESKVPRNNKSDYRYDLNFEPQELDIHPKKQEKAAYREATEDVYSGSDKTKGIAKRKKQAACTREADGSVFLLCSSNITLGRGRGNDIKLMSPGVSRSHASLIRSGDKWYIYDCGSTSGTTVNGNKISDGTRLHRGDVINLGNERLIFTDDYK